MMYVPLKSCIILYCLVHYRKFIRKSSSIIRTNHEMDATNAQNKDAGMEEKGVAADTEKVVMEEKVDMEEEKGVAIAAGGAAADTKAAGFTFAVEPGIEAAGPGSYGKNSRAYREPSTGD